MTAPDLHCFTTRAYELRAMLRGCALLARTAVHESHDRLAACVALEAMLTDLAERAADLAHGLDVLDLNRGGADRADKPNMPA